MDQMADKMTVASGEKLILATGSFLDTMVAVIDRMAEVIDKTVVVMDSILVPGTMVEVLDKMAALIDSILVIDKKLVALHTNFPFVFRTLVGYIVIE